MKKIIVILTFTTIAGCFLLNLTGCYYDKQVTPVGCDSTNVTYSKDLKPILIANCTTCHYSGNAAIVGGGYNYETSADLKKVANLKKLLPSVNHTPGADFMPKGGTKLSDCDIAKFTNWVNHNMPE